MKGRGERFVAQIRRDGGGLSAELARAFGNVPREIFVAEGFQRREGGGWVKPGDADFLDLVYADDVLVTKLDGRSPVSSSSQPSLMAGMIGALEIGPGARVLEIGAGTGYNAALMAAVGAEVTSIDVQADVAGRARSALRRAGVDGVRVVHADGYEGVAAQRFDRIIVTVGVAGLSPRWLDSLDGPGPIVAPVAHAGTQPVLTARRDPGPAEPTAKSAPPAGDPGPAAALPALTGGSGHATLSQRRAGLDPVDLGLGGVGGLVTASVLCPAGFMSASGPLVADYPGKHPAPAVGSALTPFTPAAGARWGAPLSSAIYRGLWYAGGVWSRRATHATGVWGRSTSMEGREQSLLAFLDDSRTGGAAVLPDGSVLAGGPEADRYAALAGQIIDRWESRGRPSITDWRVGFALGGDPAAPIWIPARFGLGHPAVGA